MLLLLLVKERDNSPGGWLYYMYADCRFFIWRWCYTKGKYMARRSSPGWCRGERAASSSSSRASEPFAPVV